MISLLTSSIPWLHFNHRFVHCSLLLLNWSEKGIYQRVILGERQQLSLSGGGGGVSPPPSPLPPSLRSPLSSWRHPSKHPSSHIISSHNREWEEEKGQVSADIPFLLNVEMGEGCIRMSPPPSLSPSIHSSFSYFYCTEPDALENGVKWSRIGEVEEREGGEWGREREEGKRVQRWKSKWIDPPFISFSSQTTPLSDQRNGWVGWMKGGRKEMEETKREEGEEGDCKRSTNCDLYDQQYEFHR